MQNLNKILFITHSALLLSVGLVRHDFFFFFLDEYSCSYPKGLWFESFDKVPPNLSIKKLQSSIYFTHVMSPPLSPLYLPLPPSYRTLSPSTFNYFKVYPQNWCHLSSFVPHTNKQNPLPLYFTTHSYPLQLLKQSYPLPNLVAYCFHL